MRSIKTLALASSLIVALVTPAFASSWVKGQTEFGPGFTSDNGSVSCAVYMQNGVKHGSYFARFGFLPDISTIDIRVRLDKPSQERDLFYEGCGEDIPAL